MPIMESGAFESFTNLQAQIECLRTRAEVWEDAGRRTGNTHHQMYHDAIAGREHADELERKYLEGTPWQDYRA